MSGDILQTPDAPKPQGALDNYFKITARGSTVRQEVLVGLTTFWPWFIPLSSFRECWAKQVFLPQLCLLPPVWSRASARC